ncbi:MAG TPA: CotH kinase family protein [Cryomorphaceae bacterium]|nr:CotH kinase family protein [Cryomorphaceae bacterium]
MGSVINKSIFVLLFLLSQAAWSQPIDHWEAAVIAEQEWAYRMGGSEPPTAWNQPDFNDDEWTTGQGGIGYDDGDDNTVIEPTVSLYLRLEFEIVDTAAISAVSFYADFDDAFVAYLNGVEIARSNIGTIGIAPTYDQTATTFREAQLYQGGLPDEFSLSHQQQNDLLNNGTNTLAIQVHNVGLNSSDLSALFFLLVGINDSSNSYQPVPDWFIPPFASSNLPLIFINTDGVEIPDEPKIDAWMGIIDNGSDQLNFLTDSFNDYNGNIGIEIRGSSSILFEKKSYAVETRLPDGENNNVSILGMPAENDWVLNGPYSDKSLLRNVLSFHIGRSMGRYAPRTRFCEVFINDQYQGVYVLMEKIKRDDNRVDIATLNPEDLSGDELTGGYIFSADRDDEGPESGWYSPYTDILFYKYQDPDFDELAPEQKAYLSNYFTDFEEVMDASPSADVYEEYIDVPSFIDYWIATEIFKHIDNFKLSFYMYKKKDSNGGKIHFGPLWDLNLGYGNFDFAQDPGPEGWSYIWASFGILRPEWVYHLSEDPALQNQINCRWKELRLQSLHTDSLMQFIDEKVSFLEEAQNRNFERWPILGNYVWPNAFVGETYQEETNYLQIWLSQRLNWMDENMLGDDCLFLSTNGDPLMDSPIAIFPNPFQEEVTFKLNIDSPEGAHLTLFDPLGKTILEEDLHGNTPQSYSLRYLSTGLYFFRLTRNNQIIASGKLVKE